MKILSFWNFWKIWNFFKFWIWKFSPFLHLHWLVGRQAQIYLMWGVLTACKVYSLWGRVEKMLLRPIKKKKLPYHLIMVDRVYYTITALERDQYEVLWSSHKTSYWSSSSVVIVLLHTALFYSNFEILWKLKFLKLFKNFIILNFFEILWNFWNFWNFMKILNLKKKLKF